MNTHYMPGIVVSTLHFLILLIFTTIVGGENYYHHFIDEEIQSDRLNDFSKVTERASGRALKEIGSVAATQCYNSSNFQSTNQLEQTSVRCF